MIKTTIRLILIIFFISTLNGCNIFSYLSNSPLITGITLYNISSEHINKIPLIKKFYYELYPEYKIKTIGRIEHQDGDRYSITGINNYFDPNSLDYKRFLILICNDKKCWELN